MHLNGIVCSIPGTCAGTVVVVGYSEGLGLAAADAVELSGAVGRKEEPGMH